MQEYLRVPNIFDAVPAEKVGEKFLLFGAEIIMIRGQ